MKKYRFCCSLFILFSLLLAAKTKFEFNGYYKAFNLVWVLPDFFSASADNPPAAISSHRLRLQLKAGLSKTFSLEAAWDLTPFVGQAGDAALPAAAVRTGPDTYRAFDFKQQLVPGPHSAADNFFIYHNLDRLFVTIHLPAADIFVGRQPVAWGSSRIINPTDVLTPFAFNDLDTEDRRGVDALRIRIPLGMMDEIDCGWVAGHDFAAANSAFFLRTRFYVLHTDLALLAMKFRNHLLLGFDLARSLAGAGVWVEGAWVKTAVFGHADDPEKTDYFRLSAGMDYNFSGKLYGFAEYHFNSAGSSNAADYLQNADTAAYKQNSVYLLGRSYLNLGLTWQVTPLLPATLLFISNLSDGSCTFAPTLEYNVSENIYLGMGAYISLGKKPAVPAGASPEPSGKLLRSEFGSWPRVFYLSWRIYF